ncbi:MAG: hypothetical protein K0S09_1072 [Sphingobacteriaceae bacterium]|jgi:hypothetical protein|nr:hypothetical protein [Sphingobacteriaceae bacterium]
MFERFDVDADQLAIILAVKLKMDDRRPPGLMSGRQQQKKTHNRASLMAMVILAVMGCFIAFFLVSGNAFIGHTLYFSMFMVLISLTLIADFTNVLIDVRDNYIIVPRPVKDSTVAVSRILHITIHVSKIVLALCLPGLIAITVMNGAIAAIAFLIEVLSATTLTIFVVNMVYLLLLKFSSPQRFKDFISYFQIIFSILIFAAYQMLPRLISNPDYQNLDILSYKISYLVPPVWFASFYQILLFPDTFTLEKLALAALGVIMPFFTLYVVVKFLAPGFNRKLSSISVSGQDAAEPEPGATHTRVAHSGFVQKLSSVMAKDKAELAGFRLTWWLTSRYRDFKMKVYPSFAYVPVYFAYLLFLRPGAGRSKLTYEGLRSGNNYILLTYITSFVILTVLQQVSQAEKFRAAWVMFSTPHNKPGKILAGMFKALIIKYFVPYYLVIAVFSLFTWGPMVLNDLLFAFFNIMVFALLTALFTVKHLPFSQPVNTNKQGGRVIVNLAIMSFIGLLGFVHWGLSRWEWAISGLTLVSAGICWAIYHYFRQRNWQAMEADYD